MCQAKCRRIKEQLVQPVGHRNYQEVVGMAGKGKKNTSIECTVEFTEGAQQRITDAFVDLYYQIKRGTCKGPLLPERNKEETA